jgi:hypothetical protein
VIRAGQVWTHRERRRAPWRYRVLWVSDCGGHVRVIRPGAPSGRYLTAARLRRDYRLEPAPSVNRQ